jgi:Holliday junction resolvase RusA-like endonuclease
MYKTWQDEFEILPQSKQSCGFGNKVAFTPTAKKRYVETIHILAMVHRPDRIFRGPVRMVVEFYFPYPETWVGGRTERTWRTEDPDVDNLLKPLKDALAGVIYINDNQVVSIDARKYNGPWTGIKVDVQTLTEMD